jgi:ubiquinone/menaquinone biosynthesis C-methylase UbiE
LCPITHPIRSVATAPGSEALDSIVFVETSLALIIFGGLDHVSLSRQHRRALRCVSNDLPQAMTHPFTKFEHDSWQRVAHKYEVAWSDLTRSFIPALLAAVNIRNGVRVLDVACGPGYVAAAAKAAGGEPIGVDFSSEMVRIAGERHPDIEFRVGDAQALDFPDDSFDVAIMNFGLLHLAEPEKGIAECARVLVRGGRFGFSVWAGPHLSAGAKIVDDAINEYANKNVVIPQGPDYFTYSREKICAISLARTGFDPTTFHFETVVADWMVPSPTFLFESELHAGVRTAALLVRQSRETLERISNKIAESVSAYAKGDGYAIPFAAHIISARKKEPVPPRN